MRQETEAIIQGIFFIIIVFLIFSWLYRPYIIEHNKQKEYEGMIKKNLDDRQATYYSNLCSGMIDDVDCVMSATSPIYNYVKDENRSKIRTPSQYALFGGNCRDSAVFYATIFKKLNYTIKFEFPIPKHINLIISKKVDENIYRYCVIEGNTAECYKVII
jgi:hypothetical protein